MAQRLRPGLRQAGPGWGGVDATSGLSLPAVKSQKPDGVGLSGRRLSGIQCVGTQGRWVQDWALILRARMCEHRMSVGWGSSRTACPPPCLHQAPCSLESNPSPTPPLELPFTDPSHPALCLCLLQQCSDPTPAACSQIKGLPSPACALWFLGRKGKLWGRPQTCRRCNMCGFCPRYGGVDISGA